MKYMNRILSGIACAAVAGMVASCYPGYSGMGLMAPAPLDLTDMSQYRVDREEQLSGESTAYYFCPWPLLFISNKPISQATYDEALRNALAKDPTGPVALSNGGTYIFANPPFGLLFFGSYSVRVYGNPVYKKNPKGAKKTRHPLRHGKPGPTAWAKAGQAAAPCEGSPALTPAAEAW